jgi:hypothetical protein
MKTKSLYFPTLTILKILYDISNKKVGNLKNTIFDFEEISNFTLYIFQNLFQKVVNIMSYFYTAYL